MKFPIYLVPFLLFGCTPPTPESAPAVTLDAATTPAAEPTAVPLDRDSLVAYLRGDFDPETHPDFVKVAARYTDGDPYVLRRATYAAFERMHAAAAADSVTLTIVSATRNFARQKQIWEAKWTGKRLLSGGIDAAGTYDDHGARARAILRYSSMPGTSRHHWGTDIDLNDLENSYFASGEGKRVYDWLTANAAAYGFCQPYTAKGEQRPHGYEEEKWHWSYLPLAKPLTDFAAKELKDVEINGFLGAESAPLIGVVDHYVLGINPACKR